MFEKEAEEYADKKICQEYTDGCMGFYKCKEDCERYHNTQKYWQDGAEFGYNKAKEDADKMKSRFLELCNLKDMRIKELEKANEWHNLKTEKPPLRKEVLWCIDNQLWLGQLCESWIDFGEWDIDSVLFNDYEIAWKEIVLPKESE